MNPIIRAAAALLVLAATWTPAVRAQDTDEDGVPDAVDQCALTPWSEISISAIKPGKWAVVWGEFTTISKKPGNPADAYTLDQTAGCSCTQIVDALKASGARGTNKLSSSGGCASSTLDLWIASLTAGKGGPGEPELPAGITLGSYPNPFNPATTIRFDVPSDAEVRLTVFNLLGLPVGRLLDGAVVGGTHEVTFDASHLPSGIYLVRLDYPGGTVTRAVQLMK